LKKKKKKKKRGGSTQNGVIRPTRDRKKIYIYIDGFWHLGMPMGKSSKFFLEDLVAKPPLRVKTHQIIFIFLFFWPWGGRMGWFTTPDQLSGWLHPLDQNGGGSADPHFFFQFFF
jgi:hypothetical protein